jgi:beta-glucosidase
MISYAAPGAPAAVTKPAALAPEPIARPARAAAFPPGFRWGAATSAFQIEGATMADGRGESVWDRFSRTPGKVRNGDTGDVACDHYHRYEQDLDLMQQLGIQTYRFSLAWPRIFPTGTGQINQHGLDFYKRLAEGLLRRGIRPMATLFHWDLPQALQDQGGWENRDVAEHFGVYADTVFRALGDLVPGWLTFNEPKTVLFAGYIQGVHAPGFQDPHRGYPALHHMLLGHGLAVRAFQALGPRPDQQIGIPLNLAPVYSDPAAPADADAVTLQDGFENRLYLDPIMRGGYPADMLAELAQYGFERVIRPGDLATIGQPINLLGITYYNPIYVRGRYEVVAGPNPYSEASWQGIYPQGMYDILLRVKRDYGDIPITITENGRPTADRLGANGQVDDPAREAFLRDHFAATRRAIDAGVNVESYHVWSLMDNFEWAEGYEQRWGIVYVDYASQRRVPKRSALWYKRIIESHGADLAS